MQLSKPKLTRVVFKPMGQSPTEITKLAESAQCVYLAIAQVKGQSDETDITLDLSRYKPYFNIDTNVAEIRRKLSNDWFQSSAVIANHLTTKLYGGKDYVFHRNSVEVRKVYDKFKAINSKLPKDQKFSQADKWQPADIWAIKRGFTFKLGSIKTLEQLNHYLRELIDKQQALPLSLKKASSTRPNIIGIGTNKELRSGVKEIEPVEYTGFLINTGRTNMLSSKNVQIKFKQGHKEGYVTIRNSSPGAPTNGEVQMKSANHNLGKINRDSIIATINPLATKKIGQYNPTTLRDASYRLDPDLIKKTHELASRLDPTNRVTLDELTEHVTTKASAAKSPDKDWLNSKYQGLIILDGFASIPEADKTTAVQQIFTKARALGDLSAPRLEIK